MFQQLIESGARPVRRTGWTVASAALHATLAAAAVALTVREQPRIADRPPPPITYIGRPAPAPPPPVLPAGQPGAPRWLAPLEIPIAIPPVPEMTIPTATHHFAPVGTESLGSGLVTTPISSGSPDAIYSALTVERAVRPRPDNPAPVYPATLRSSHVEGEVLVQFVVDTSGRVESRSIVIVRATHPLFGEAVQRWLGRTRYVPANVSGQPVRQLVQQTIAFTLRP